MYECPRNDPYREVNHESIVPVHAMKTYWSGDIALFILSLGTVWRRGVRLTPGKSPWFFLNGWLCGFQSRSGRFGE